MASAAGLTSDEIRRLRRQHYNARIIEFRRVHEDLAILRVRPDAGRVEYTPGQYTVLGLGYWERRLGGTQEESLDEADFSRLIRRAYSVSSPLLDAEDQLVDPAMDSELEFYISLVRFADHPPALTPRLFAMAGGNSIHLATRCHGHYSLAGINPTDAVIFMATGTGEAPHNTMIAKLLTDKHEGPIVSVVCTRYKMDQAYVETYRRLEKLFPTFAYHTLTTREPINIEPTTPGFLGKQYLQEYFASGNLEQDCGFRLDPRHTHVYLCGNPTMIGVPRHTHDTSQRYPTPIGMVEWLERRGFQLDRPHDPGTIHFEKYW